MLRTMLAELTPSVADESGRWRAAGGRGGAMRDELNRRRAITLVPSRGARVAWSRR